MLKNAYEAACASKLRVNSLQCSASGWASQTHQLRESIRCSSMLCEVRVILILVWVLLAAHEQHVLQVMAETLQTQGMPVELTASSTQACPLHAGVAQGGHDST